MKDTESKQVHPWDQIVHANGKEIGSWKYIALAAKHLQNLRRVGETLYFAQSMLSKDELHRFCEKIGIKNGSPEYRKYLKMATSADFEWLGDIPEGVVGLLQERYRLLMEMTRAELFEKEDALLMSGSLD
jgi:hypothetical protein